MKWAKITVTISQEASDAVANYLFELNAVGLEIKEQRLNKLDIQPSEGSKLSEDSIPKCRSYLIPNPKEVPTAPFLTTLIAYFPMDDLVGDRGEKLKRFLAQLSKWGIDPKPASIDLTFVEEENWAEAWRSAFPPQKIGNHLIIAPTWHQMTLQPSEVLIQLDPGMAFGTGQHPTTRLSLELLEETITGNEAVADLGTGSGILAIAAARLGAKSVDAVDLDTTTTPIAKENIQLNRVESIVCLHEGDGLKALTGHYDVIMANILTKVILPMIPQFPGFLRPDGQVILSGVMDAEAEQVEVTLEGHGFHCLETRKMEEWVGIRARLAANIDLNNSTKFDLSQREFDVRREKQEMPQIRSYLENHQSI